MEVTGSPSGTQGRRCSMVYVAGFETGLSEGETPPLGAGARAGVPAEASGKAAPAKQGREGVPRGVGRGRGLREEAGAQGGRWGRGLEARGLHGEEARGGCMGRWGSWHVRSGGGWQRAGVWLKQEGSGSYMAWRGVRLEGLVRRTVPGEGVVWRGMWGIHAWVVVKVLVRGKAQASSR